MKNVGGLEDGGETGLASEAEDGEILLASGRLLAGRPRLPVPASGVSGLLETEQGSSAKKDARRAGPALRPPPSAGARDTHSTGTVSVALRTLAPGIVVFLTSLTLR